MAGRAYFLSQGDPWPLWDLINGILAAAHLPPVTRTVSPKVAHLAGAVLEATHRLFRLPGEPRMTRFLAHQLSSAHWFNIDAARRDLGYEPAVSIEEGLRRLGRLVRPRGRTKPIPTGRIAASILNIFRRNGDRASNTLSPRIGPRFAGDGRGRMKAGSIDPETIKGEDRRGMARRCAS